VGRAAIVDAGAGTMIPSLRTWTCLPGTVARLAFCLLARDRRAAELPVEMSAFKAQQFRWPRARFRWRANCCRVSCVRRHPGAEDRASSPDQHFAYPLLLLLSLLLLPNLIVRTTHGVREVLMIDIPLFFGTTLSIASFYLASEREIARLRGDSTRTPWSTLRRLPWFCRSGSGCA